MGRVRGILRRLRAETLERSGWSARSRARLDGSRAAILAYHRVLPRSEAQRLAVEPGMFVTPETFAAHLSWLEESFRVLALGEVVERLAADRPLPPGACALSFDDGWHDNLVHALPALERRGLPATIFVVTERVGTSGAFWPDEVCRRMGSLPAAARRSLARELGARPRGDPVQAVLALLKSLAEPERAATLARLRARSRELGAAEPVAEDELLSWEQLALMARGGFAVESHAATHALLTRLLPAEAGAELRRAREALRERGFGAQGLLAYPSGAHDAGVRAMAREAGYRAAVTGDPGLAQAGGDPMALPRITLHEDVSRSRAEFRRRIPGA